MCYMFIMLFLPNYQAASEEDGQQYLDGPWTNFGTFCVVMIMLTRLLIQEDWEIEFDKLRSTRILVIIRTSEAAVTTSAPPHTLFPATSSKLTDLDQAAALGTVLVILLYAWSEQFISMAIEVKEKAAFMWTRSLRTISQWQHGVPVLVQAVMLRYRRPQGLPTAPEPVSEHEAST